MRVLHMGNVANNGYLNAKLMRRAGVQADALCDEAHVLSQPEWEDAPIEGAFADFVSLREAAARVGWHRPEWVKSADGATPRSSREWLNERARLALAAPGLFRRFRGLEASYRPLEETLGTKLGYSDVLRAWAWLARLDRSAVRLRQLLRGYDVIQANGLHPILALFGEPEHPYVAFEHGTMREIPFEDTWMGRLLAVAYRRAAAVVITNPDVLPAARRLGIDHYEFIPHPVDETKYTPGPTGVRGALELGDRLVLFSPSSQNWAIKGNDRMVHGFAEFLRGGNQNAVLLLTEWGLELERTRSLIHQLGIEAHVRWLPALPKLRMIEVYRAADIVLDQFLIGTFGAVAPEAMACGRAVVMAFDDSIHQWCFDELPPIVRASTPKEVCRALTRLSGNAAERDEIGQRGRAWIERHHGWRLVVERHLRLYERIL